MDVLRNSGGFKMDDIRYYDEDDYDKRDFNEDHLIALAKNDMLYNISYESNGQRYTSDYVHLSELAAIEELSGRGYDKKDGDRFFNDKKESGCIYYLELIR